MGDSRISNALLALSGGLQNIANYRGAKEAKDEERAYQTERDESQRAFSKTLAEMQMAHADKNLEKTQDFTREMAKDSQLFQVEMFDKQAAKEAERFAQTMAMERERIAIARQAATKGDKDENLGKKLRVYELDMTAAAGEYQSVAKAMNAEIAALDKDPLLNAPGQEAKRAAKETAIAQRYAPQLAETRQAIQKPLSAMKEILKMPDENSPKGKAQIGAFSFGPAAPAAPGDGAVDRAKIEGVVSQAAAIPGAASMSEAELVQRLMAASPLSRQEAVVAARQIRAASGGP